MEVSGERHAPAALTRAWTDTPWIVPGWVPEPVWIFEKENPLALAGIRTAYRPGHSIVSARYTGSLYYLRVMKLQKAVKKRGR